MKILCLHGYGTSAEILKTQLKAFIDRADPSIQFFFLQGEIECAKAQGVGNFVNGPFLCYNASWTPADIQNSCQLVDEYIEENGPFDGVIGFSQGGSLALTYLFQHAAEPEQPPPFRFAVLFSTVIAFSPLDDFGNDVFETLTERDVQLLNEYPASDLSVLEDRKRVFCGTIAKTFDSALSGGFIAMDLGLRVFRTGANPLQARVIHPEITKTRICVPTVHVVGKRDSQAMVDLSRLMQDICERKLVKALVHSGGHDVPRKAEDIRAVWQAVDWAIQESYRQPW